jgi:hypothetical protein
VEGNLFRGKGYSRDSKRRKHFYRGCDDQGSITHKFSGEVVHKSQGLDVVVFKQKHNALTS